MKEDSSAPSSLLRLVREHPYWSTALALGMVLALFLISGSRSTETSETAYYEVRRGNFTVSVVEGGTLQAVNEVAIRNEVEGTSRIIYIVPEGSYVEKDDLLVELDSMQAQDQFNQQQISFEQAQFNLIQSEKQLEIQRSQVESDNRAADLLVEFATMDLEKYLKGEAMVETLTASNNITKTAEQLAIDQETLRWSEELAGKGYETKNVLDRDRLTVTNQTLNLQIQQMQLWMIENYDYPKRKRELESAVEEAEKERERIIQQGLNRIAQAEADLLTQSNTLALNRAKLERDQKNLDATKIIAPQDGLVVYPMSESRFSSESMIEEGATVRMRQELIKLPDTSEMKVTIKVHESHVNMVETGQPAWVVLDSMPDQRFAAYVHRVALLPDNQSRFGNPNLKVYKTEVYVTDPMGEIKPGVSARAEVIITNIQDTVSVPIQAVTTLKGKQVVYVKNGSSHKPVQVTIGMFNTKFIQVLEGVDDGDRVLLSPPFEERDLEGAILGDEENLTGTNIPPRRVMPETTQTGPNGGRAASENQMGAMEGGRGGQPGTRGETARQGGPGGGGNMTQEQRDQMRAQMMARFDKDGDGKISEEERAAIQAQFGGGMGGRGGSGGGGERSGRAPGGDGGQRTPRQ